MTLNGTLLHKTCVFRSPPHRRILYMTNRYSSVTLVSGNIRRGHQTAVGCRLRLFLVFSLAISSEPLEIRPTLLYSDTESLVGFPLIPQCMTLNDPECLFYVKFSYRDCSSRTFCVNIENCRTKTN